MKKKYSFLLIVYLIVWNKIYCQAPDCQHLKSTQIATPIYYSPENLRSDTIDIIKYTINLTIIDYINQKISGNTTIRFTPKINNQTKIHLDLLKLSVDSVKQSNTTLSYTYNDTLLNIILPTPVNILDTTSVTVYYKGKPQGDPAGWGGFSFSGNYAYNLGVGFGAKPHNYGRVWFPCFDNFVEKSAYEFNITTDTLKSAYCNGTLISDIKHDHVRTRKWILDKQIPSYLASVAVADYTQVNWLVNTSNGSLPIVLAARANDTTNLKTGFIHLPNAILGYEHYYGPYLWNRVGYCLVPFSSGAMEHATNIAYPQNAIGNTNYESDLMAHELSHHWWGDLMTCETQEDMWLNEGMASYSERMFLEWVYGYKSYLAEVKTVHDDMVKYAHLREKGFRAISGIPHQYTYGDHVYKKGSDVAHTLRTYMGDTAFFAGLKYVLQQKAYKNMNSLEFRNLLQTSSGKNLTDFFDNWVFNGGWPHFSIDSIITSGSSAPYTQVVYVKQKSFGAPTLYSNVPIELTFMNNGWIKEVKKINMSGALNSFTMQTTILPTYTGINVDSKISDAISSEYKVLKTNGTIIYALGRATIIVSNKGADSSYIRVEHNFAKPDAIKNNPYNFRLNSQHYWKIDGILSSGFAGKLRLNYDGNKNKSGNSYLDTCLTTINGDSIILLYRKNAGSDWQEVTNYSKFKLTTKTGFITADTLKFGEYVFANGHSNILLDLNEPKHQSIQLHLFPNPVSNILKINIKNYNLNTTSYIDIYDLEGKLVKHIEKINIENTISISGFLPGYYTVLLIDKNKSLVSKPFIVE